MVLLVKEMKTKRKGYYRDNEVKRSIEKFEILSTEQIYVLHFSNIKCIEYGLNKTRERMRKMRGVKKRRLDFRLPTFYYMEGKSKMNNAIHDVNRNWGFIYLIKLHQDKYKFDGLRIEYVIGNVRSDGFLRLCRYIDDKDVVYYFVESDMSGSKNKFDKIGKYNELFRSKGYINEDWVRDVKHFPHVLIVIDGEGKRREIEDKIKKENIEGLEFIVLSVDEIKTRLGY